MQSESKREEFRRYLEGTGVLDALTKVLVGLYEEPDKPSDALEYPPVYIVIVHTCTFLLQFISLVSIAQWGALGA